MIELARMNRVLEINPRWTATPSSSFRCGQPASLESACALHGLGITRPIPPAMWRVHASGGNIAEKRRGPHTLKYGVTTNHILGLEVVLPSGEIVTLGGPVRRARAT